MDQVSYQLLRWLEKQQGTLFHPLSPTLLLFFFLSLYFLLRRSQKLNLPPSPPKLPIIGNLHQIGTLAHRSLRDLSCKYGGLMLLHFGHAPILVVSSKNMAKEIMKTNDVTFANRPLVTAARELIYGGNDISFSPYGEYWRQIRKFCVMRLLGVKKVQSFMFVREEEVGLMVEKISHACSLGTTINLSEMLLNLTRDVISRCALGKKYGEDGDNRLWDLPWQISEHMATFSFGDFFPSIGFVDVVTGFVRRLRKTAKALDSFFDQVIEEHELIHDNKDKEDDFVDLLLQAQKENTLDINLTRDNIKAIILDVFTAGIETTASTIEWGMAELVRNPKVLKKAQEEVRRVVGRRSKVEMDDIRKMDYLRCVIKETLRLHPVAPTLLPRESYGSTCVGGYDIPSRTRVLINAWAIQRDPESWTEAEEFIPERFMGKEFDFEGRDFEFIPFGSGRRICPGMTFALALVEFAIANLLYWFDWKLPGDAKKEELDMSEAFGLGLRKQMPLHLVPIASSIEEGGY